MEGNREIGVVIDGRITMDAYVLLIKGTGIKSSHTPKWLTRKKTCKIGEVTN